MLGTSEMLTQFVREKQELAWGRVCTGSSGNMFIHSYDHEDGAESGPKAATFSVQGLRKRLASTAQAVRKRVRFTRKLCFGPIEKCVFTKKAMYETPAQVPLL